VSRPVAYLITFTTYGSWLHGGERPSVDDEHSEHGAEYIGQNSARKEWEKANQKENKFELNECGREIVLKEVLDVCKCRSWHGHAVHVRSNHVHVVVTGECRPEKMLCGFKANATLALKAAGFKREKFWTSHGSTRYIWSDAGLVEAVHYVEHEQGEMMAFGRTGGLK